MPQEDLQCLTAKQLASTLNVGLTTIYRLIKAKKLLPVRGVFSSKRLFRVKDVLALLDKK